MPNREVQDWVDELLGKYTKQGSPITPETVAMVVSDAIIAYSKQSELTCPCECHAKVKGLLEQNRTTYDEVVEKLKSCCGAKAGEDDCHMWSCGDLKRIAVQLLSTGV